MDEWKIFGPTTTGPGLYAESSWEFTLAKAEAIMEKRYLSTMNSEKASILIDAYKKKGLLNAPEVRRALEVIGYSALMPEAPTPAPRFEMVEAACPSPYGWDEDFGGDFYIEVQRGWARKEDMPYCYEMVRDEFRDTFSVGLKDRDGTHKVIVTDQELRKIMDTTGRDKSAIIKGVEALVLHRFAQTNGQERYITKRRVH